MSCPRAQSPGDWKSLFVSYHLVWDVLTANFWPILFRHFNCKGSECSCKFLFIYYLLTTLRCEYASYRAQLCLFVNWQAVTELGRPESTPGWMLCQAAPPGSVSWVSRGSSPVSAAGALEPWAPCPSQQGHIWKLVSAGRLWFRNYWSYTQLSISNLFLCERTYLF